MLLKAQCGEVVGAIGISGASADEDEYCALQGVWDCDADDIASTCVTEPLDHSVSPRDPTAWFTSIMHGSISPWGGYHEAHTWLACRTKNDARAVLHSARRLRHEGNRRLKLCHASV